MYIAENERRDLDAKKKKLLDTHDCSPLELRYKIAICRNSYTFL